MSSYLSKHQENILLFLGGVWGIILSSTSNKFDGVINLAYVIIMSLFVILNAPLVKKVSIWIFMGVIVILILVFFLQVFGILVYLSYYKSNQAIPDYVQFILFLPPMLMVIEWVAIRFGVLRLAKNC